MNFGEYQKKALSTDVFDSKSVGVSDPAFVAKILGLVGEAGEVAEKFKKIIRNKNGELSAEDKEDICKELGDVLWYTAVLSHYLGSSLEEVGRTNLEKLSDRHKRGVIKSLGDDR